MKGKTKVVHFVGAGPGAEDLITVRGLKLVMNADIIIYAGSLVNKEILNNAKEGADIYDSARMNLDEVLDVFVSGNRAGKDIVRLHTGDPCIYGAIREQMDRLDQLGIEYDYTPGVSSFCGAAAALRAEYTLPSISQSIIITRQSGRTPVPERESIKAFAKHGATMVIFLSAGMTDKVQEELLAGGYSNDTPAAIVYKASWPDEKVMRCTVGTLHDTAVRNGISNLALLCIGDFLGSDYELSKLYDKSFTTGFRQGTDI